MNLIIDQGNTFAKVFIFKDEKIIYSARLQPPFHNQLSRLFIEMGYPQHAIYSSVGYIDKSVQLFLTANCKKFIFFSPQTSVPLTIHYETPETLGSDRIAAATGALALFPDQNILVIDAGTAITFDLVTKPGIFAGGNISPGVSLRFKALHQHTEKLPLAEPEENFSLTGNSTYNAVLYGVMNSVLFEIEHYIQHYSIQYSDIKCVLTGGDAPFFVKKIKSHIFAVPELVAIGLNRILNYNVI